MGRQGHVALVLCLLSVWAALIVACGGDSEEEGCQPVPREAIEAANDVREHAARLIDYLGRENVDWVRRNASFAVENLSESIEDLEDIFVATSLELLDIKISITQLYATVLQTSSAPPEFYTGIFAKRAAQEFYDEADQIIDEMLTFCR